MKALLNDDGELDEDKLAAKIEELKAIDSDDIPENELGPRAREQFKKMFRDLRDDFIEEAGKERDEESPEEIEEPDIGLNFMQKRILEAVEDDADRLLIKEILLMVQEKKEQEFEEDFQLRSPTDTEEENRKEYLRKRGQNVSTSDTEEGDNLFKRQTNTERDKLKKQEKMFEAIEQRFKDEYGYHLHSIEDEEEFKEAWADWVRTTAFKKKNKYTTKTIDQI